MTKIISPSHWKSLALKKSSNNEVFEHVKITFDKALKTPEFIYENEKNNFTDADGKITYLNNWTLVSLSYVISTN